MSLVLNGPLRSRVGSLLLVLSNVKNSTGGASKHTLPITSANLWSLPARPPSPPPAAVAAAAAA